MINHQLIAIAPLFRRASLSTEQEFSRLVDAAVRSGENPLVLKDAFREFTALSGYQTKPPEQKSAVLREFLEVMGIRYELPALANAA